MVYEVDCRVILASVVLWAAIIGVQDGFGAACGECLGDCFQAQVTTPRVGPFVVLLGQYGTDEAQGGGAVGEDADHVAAAADLAASGAPGGCWTRPGARPPWAPR